MFDDGDCNDCRYFDFSYDIEYRGYWWEDEEEVKLANLIRSHLREIFPDRNYVLIDIVG